MPDRPDIEAGVRWGPSGQTPEGQGFSATGQPAGGQRPDGPRYAALPVADIEAIEGHLIEEFRRALMECHSDDWTMTTCSEAAHICAGVVAPKVAEIGRLREALTDAVPHDHRISWVIEGDWITGKLTCSAPEGSICRLVCEKGCESWPCTGDDHELVDGGSCNAVEWINETGPQEAHGGDGSETLRDGPVDVWWSGTSWRWAYRRDAS